MSIVNLDGIIAGTRPPIFFGKSVTASLSAGRPWSMWVRTGTTGIGVFDTTLNGVALSQTGGLVSGALPHYDPASGNAYLSRFHSQVGSGGSLLLLDRLWHNGGFDETLTTQQDLSSVTWPTRCPTSGLDDTPSSNGYGVLIALEVSAAGTNSDVVATLGYTNSAGANGRTSVNLVTVGTNSPIGATYFFGLQGGDVGVRSVQSLTLNVSWGAGCDVNLVAYRVLTVLETTASSIGNAVDAITGGFPRLYNGTTPWLVFVPNGAFSGQVIGSIVEAHG